MGPLLSPFYSGSPNSPLSAPPVAPAEAAKQIFSPTESADQPPWDGSGLEFSGDIKHHESQRLRAVYEAVKNTRQAITGALLLKTPPPQGKFLLGMDREGCGCLASGMGH